MKLTTKQGQFDLPQDFLLTMARTNPMLSDEGDASVPATLPASSNNLAVLEHRERIDRARRYNNKVEAILEVGPVHKHGQLVIDSVSRDEGIDASFAIDNSDLYAKSKSKSLKEIFANVTQSFPDVDSACMEMWHIYGGDTGGNEDYNIFPVAVAPYEDEDGNKVWQYNNEISEKGVLVYESRGVREDDILMSVPKGYGIAPFLKLYRLIDILFDCLGYRVVYNCFATTPELQALTIVHNCSDCFCNPTCTLYYRDLVPSCTLSEFLEWLQAKFHVQPVVDSDAMEVRVMTMEMMLDDSGLDPERNTDISNMVVGAPTVVHSPTRRIVLQPTNSLDDTTPAADTFDTLIAQHETYMAMYEPLFAALNGSNPTFLGGLLLRKSTGVFYEQGLRLIDAKPVLNPIGTNHFTYDRDNSEETEEYSQADVMPLMLCNEKTHRVEPYIGNRLHYHTSYKNKKEDSKQDIIVVRAYASRDTAYRTTGTTQQFIPDTGSGGVSFSFDLTNYGLYNLFWEHYNEILLNNETRVSAKLMMNVAEFLHMKLAYTKLCQNQRLLPEKISATLGSRMSLADAEFILLQNAIDKVHDETIPASQISSLQWSIFKYEEITAQSLVPPGKVLLDYVFTYPYNGGVVYPGPPQYEGEERTLMALADVRIGVEDQAGGRTEWLSFQAVGVTVLLRA